MNYYNCKISTLVFQINQKSENISEIDEHSGTGCQLFWYFKCLLRYFSSFSLFMIPYVRKSKVMHRLEKVTKE